MKTLKQQFLEIWAEHCGDLKIQSGFKTTKELKNSRMLLRSMGEKLGVIEKNESFDNIELLGQILKLGELLGVSE